MSVIRKPVSVSPVAAVDKERAEIRAQMGSLAAAEAEKHGAIDALTEEMRSDLDAGLDSTEVEGKILAARADLERLALRRAALERLAVEKDAALQEKKHRLRDEALEQAEAVVRQSFASEYKGVVEISLQLSDAYSRLSKHEVDLHNIAGALSHLHGLPRGTAPFVPVEVQVETAFLARHPEGTRGRLDAASGSPTWSLLSIDIPVMTPTYVTAAVEADKEMAASGTV